MASAGLFFLKTKNNAAVVYKLRQKIDSWSKTMFNNGP
jgi:hypothetical protein